MSPPSVCIGRRGVLAFGVAALVRPAWADDESETIAFAGQRLRFAGVEDGRRVLTADDDWLPTTSGFQRGAMMGAAEPTSLDAFRRWNGEAVLPWQAAQRTRWRAAALQIDPRVRELRLPLPRETLLVQTNGQESARMPYTRANAIVITTPNATPRDSDAFLVAHELWHVVSRHAPALADRVYREIGFEPIGPVAWPAGWDAIRIANPDAPGMRHAMRLSLEGREAWVAPALVASSTSLPLKRAFAEVFEVRLLEVRPEGDGGRWSAVAGADGQPRWHDLERTAGYLERLGGNTGYVIHPEETIADNVALLLTGQSARNAALLRRIEAALRSA